MESEEYKIEANSWKFEVFEEAAQNISSKRLDQAIEKTSDMLLNQVQR